MKSTKVPVLDVEKKIDDYYYELIMAVETKYPNETRHETALKYIKQAEHGGPLMKIKCVDCSGSGYNVLVTDHCVKCKGDGCIDNPKFLGVTRYEAR